MAGLLFVATVFAGSGWVEPSNTAVSLPVPLSSEGMQAKQAGIAVGSLYANGAQFSQQLFIAGTIKSDAGILHLNTAGATGVVVSADLRASDILQSDNIKNTSGAAPLCADDKGSIILCPIDDVSTSTGPTPVFSVVKISVLTDNASGPTIKITLSKPLSSDLVFTSVKVVEGLFEKEYNGDRSGCYSYGGDAGYFVSGFTIPAGKTDWVVSSGFVKDESLGRGSWVQDLSGNRVVKVSFQKPSLFRASVLQNNGADYLESLYYNSFYAKNGIDMLQVKFPACNAQ